MADESQYRLRIPADLKAKLEEAARASGRSMNAQVLYTLQLAMEQADELEDLRQKVKDHEVQLQEVWIHIETLQAFVSPSPSGPPSVRKDQPR
ncbi:hypothetical protein NS277_16420 [Novosphingobium barchaimii]|nr:hypothetical protein NS277_16420 [Novosphingobium barchaimii]